MLRAGQAVRCSSSACRDESRSAGVGAPPVRRWENSGGLTGVLSQATSRKVAGGFACVRAPPPAPQAAATASITRTETAAGVEEDIAVLSYAGGSMLTRPSP